MNSTATNNPTNIRVASALDDLTNKSPSQRGISRTGLLVPLLRASQARGEIPGRNGPDLDAVLLEHAHPVPHHHVHARLAGPIGRGGQALLGPPFGWRVVDGDLQVVAFRHVGRAAGHEQDPRVRRFQQERHQRVRQDVGAGRVDVPGFVPHLSHAQFAFGSFDIEHRS